MLRLASSCGLAVLLLFTAVQAQPQASQPPLPPGEGRCYMMVFGAQHVPLDVRYTHSFAIFAQEACGPGGKKLNSVAISWLASSGVIRPAALMPEEGRNYSIPETFAWIHEHGMRVSMWGPFEVKPEIYHRAVARYNQLNSGTVQYKLLDVGYHPDRVANCIRAITPIAEEPRLSGAGAGENASYAITVYFKPYYINPDHKHLWVARTLDLGKYPIIYRDFDPPQSNVFWGAVHRITHQPEQSPPTQVLDPVPPLPGPVPQH
jgi:hypothetical protein